MTARGYFITGTDTGIGKTRVATGLIAGFMRQGMRVLAMKPVACGYAAESGRNINADVFDIATLTGQNPENGGICSYSLAEPISPNLAAEHANIRVELRRISDHYLALAAISDVVVVEGAGGWDAPISLAETMADVAVTLRLPVILTVGLRLGCLNHTLLTARSIRHRGLPLAGWVANHIDPAMQASAGNIRTLAAFLRQPPLAVLPHDPTGSSSRPLLADAAQALSARGALE